MDQWKERLISYSVLRYNCVEFGINVTDNWMQIYLKDTKKVSKCLGIQLDQDESHKHPLVDH